jgi:anthranilate phosphoribosyltransferase
LGRDREGLLILYTMKNILNYLYLHKTLSRDEAKTVLTNIAQGAYNHSQIASFMSVYIMRSITVEELSGFRDALLELCVPVKLDGYNTIDLCGTGGDGKNTFNISTISSFVVAGAGNMVTKHGNYGVSSGCGSSNVMETIGYKYSTDTAKLKSELDATGFCYMHAPIFNPAMKNVAPVRKDLAVRTFINMLGPMINPSRPKNQMVGVYSLELARLYTYLYQQSGINFIILHGLDGYDEISLTSEFKLISNKFEEILSPEQIGLSRVKPEDLAGGETVKESVELFYKILEGKGTTAQNDIIFANSAVALKCLNSEKSYADCIAEAKDSLMGGKALRSMKKLIEMQK